DPFPLLGDVHVGTPEISAYPYNRQWSTTPPLSAHPIPVIGLWAPNRKLYAAWDFQAARLTDNSERDIATGFCNRLILPDVGNSPRPNSAPRIPSLRSAAEGPIQDAFSNTPAERSLSSVVEALLAAPNEGNQGEGTGVRPLAPPTERIQGEGPGGKP